MYHSIPLDSDKGEIRLLRVLPGEFFSKIKCELFKVSLDDKPDYKALSYVWGDSADRENIVVNGHDVAVTVNLGQSLRRLRSHSAGQPLTLWADAVCINQENLDELGAQVSIMGRIYSSCSGVCIWLGPCGSENVTQCLDFNLPPSATSPGDTTPSLSTQFSEYAESHSDDIVSGLARCAHALVRFAFGAHLREVEPFAAGSESSYHPMLDAMKNLASSPWFGRAWIVQEARLAPSATVYIGNVALAGKVLWHAYKNRKKLAATCPDCRGGPETAPFLDAMNGFIGDLVRLALKDPDGTEMSQVSVPGLFLLQFSLLHRHQECCRDVDRIYAYVGIVENLSGVKSLKPDYHLTAPQLYLRVCADAVVSGRTLTFLAWNTAKNRYSELPSWVVDWTNTVSTEELTHMFISKCWAAATELEFRVRIDNDKILVTKGLEIDRVSDIGSVWRNENQSILDPTLWAQWHQVAGLHDNPDRLYPSGGTYRDAWWKALCFDSTNAEYKRSNYEMRAFELVSTILPHSYINFDSNLSQECQDLGFALSVESLDNLFKFTTREIWGTLPHMLNNCRLFATQKGRLGFSRDALQVGDPIFLLPNCPAPLILRQTGDTFVGGGEFEGESLNGHPLHVLISDAYIYGIMDGEAVQAMGSSLSKITIRSMDEVPERYRYIGKERGEESGLYYCGAGYYAPWIMRWISPDPMDARDGMNLYGYASSNPVKHVDMTGFTTNNPSPNQRRATFKEGISQGKLIEGPIAEHLDYPEGVKSDRQVKAMERGAYVGFTQRGRTSLREWISDDMSGGRDVKAIDREKDQGHVEAQKAAASTEKAAVQTEESAVQPEKALVQSERAATNPVKKLLQTAKESKIGETIEKVATKAAPAVKVLGHLAGALDTVETVESIVDDVQTLRHYDGWGEKAVAVLDIASNALILIPAPQTRAIGMGITMGVAAGRALYEFFKSPDPPPSPPVETMPADKPQAPEGFPCVCCTPLGKGCMTFAK